MSNYEIMILTNTEMLESDLTKLLTSTLKVKDVKLNKLERNELVYPIKKQTRANYYVVNLKIDPSLIAKLTRKFNIAKLILRYLIINLDTEKGLKPKKASRFNKFHKFNKFSQSNNYVNKQNKTSEENAENISKENVEKSASSKQPVTEQNKETKKVVVKKLTATKTSKSKTVAVKKAE